MAGDVFGVKIGDAVYSMYDGDYADAFAEKFGGEVVEDSPDTCPRCGRPWDGPGCLTRALHGSINEPAGQ